MNGIPPRRRRPTDYLQPSELEQTQRAAMASRMSVGETPFLLASHASHGSHFNF